MKALLKDAWEALVGFYKDERGDFLQTAIIMAVLGTITAAALYFLYPKIKANIDKTGQQLDKGSSFNY